MWPDIVTERHGEAELLLVRWCCCVGGIGCCEVSAGCCEVSVAVRCLQLVRCLLATVVVVLLCWRDWLL